MQGYNTKPLHQFLWRIHTDQCNSLDTCRTPQGNYTGNTLGNDYEDYVNDEGQYVNDTYREYVNDEGRAIGQQTKGEEEQTNGGLRVMECAFDVTIMIFLLTV